LDYQIDRILCVRGKGDRLLCRIEGAPRLTIEFDRVDGAVSWNAEPKLHLGTYRPGESDVAANLAAVNLGFDPIG
jgi:hypothetical protein